VVWSLQERKGVEPCRAHGSGLDSERARSDRIRSIDRGQPGNYIGMGLSGT